MKLTLDGRQIEDRDDFYRVIKEQVALPDWFGNNLDALHDILSEAGEAPAVHVYGLSNLRQALGDHYLMKLFLMMVDCGGEILILS